MPGFFVSNEPINVKLYNKYPEKCIIKSLDLQGITVSVNTLNKFINDKVCSNTKNLVIVLEGYLLNKKELYEKYQVNSIELLIDKMYKLQGQTFFREFRGSFSGGVYDKIKQIWIIFTNQTGDSYVFYASNGKSFFAGSQVNYILDACRSNKLKLTLDEQAAYQLMTFGFMEDDSTFAKEVKRLRGGTYLYVHQGEIEVKKYHRFHKDPKKFSGKSENEIIEELDKGFRKAVKLEYDKDIEYGYKHLADMSGGLDSRMSVWVEHTINPYTHMLLLTYCKANYLDELIAKEIAQCLKDEILVKPLDDVSYMYDIDENVRLNGGLSIYAGITGGKRLLESLDMSKYGLEHTGMIGDVVIGSFCHNNKELQDNHPSGKYSERLTGYLTKTNRNDFEDQELYLLYSRALQGAGNTLMMRKNYTEVASPFMNPDFLQLCFDIPVELRANHYIYKKWIIKKYPKAADFTWEKIGCKITTPSSIILVRNLVVRGAHKLLRILGQENRISTGMNPLAYWVSKDTELQKYFNKYENDFFNSCPVKLSNGLCSNIKKMHRQGNINEKIMSLTVMAAIKLYFGEQ